MNTNNFSLCLLPRKLLILLLCIIFFKIGNVDSINNTITKYLGF